MARPPFSILVLKLKKFDKLNLITSIENGGLAIEIYLRKINKKYNQKRWFNKQNLYKKFYDAEYKHSRS
jgi:hypothetical protein